MRRFARERCWALAALAFVALLVAQVGGPVAQSAGREFSRCIQSCNDTRKECGRACQDDCKELYPDDKQMSDTCTADCKNGTCEENSSECKQICQNIKDPPSPEEP